LDWINHFNFAVVLSLAETQTQAHSMFNASAAKNPKNARPLKIRYFPLAPDAPKSGNIMIHTYDQLRILDHTVKKKRAVTDEMGYYRKSQEPHKKLLKKNKFGHET
jgi:hypothetical protein